MANTNTLAVNIITKLVRRHGVLTYPFAAEPEVKLVPDCRVIRMQHRFLLINTKGPKSPGHVWAQVQLSDEAIVEHFSHLDVL